MKTIDLTGPALDWAVAKCKAGAEFIGEIDNPHFYSTDWAQGGPTIEREGVVLDFHGDHWTALMWWDDEKSAAEITMRGPTPLIAAMRCYVASVLGDSVNVPDELCN